ncbi:hypothetical protein EGH82_20490 [Vibrio ponticus]|uniref:Uncharacterized protein n=1 Tax=Vibrio ponticus TaxID=265668 RepID=A0A3N3DU53_9VIBR|nr:hypothetical protein EGH82_20490 [Vibrio ponticus]
MLAMLKVYWKIDKIEATEISFYRLKPEYRSHISRFFAKIWYINGRFFNQKMSLGSTRSQLGAFHLN